MLEREGTLRSSHNAFRIKGFKSASKESSVERAHSRLKLGELPFNDSSIQTGHSTSNRLAALGNSSKRQARPIGQSSSKESLFQSSATDFSLKQLTRHNQSVNIMQFLENLRKKEEKSEDIEEPIANPEDLKRLVEILPNKKTKARFVKGSAR